MSRELILAVSLIGGFVATVAAAIIRSRTRIVHQGRIVTARRLIRGGRLSACTGLAGVHSLPFCPYAKMCLITACPVAQLKTLRRAGLFRKAIFSHLAVTLDCSIGARSARSAAKPCAHSAQRAILAYTRARAGTECAARAIGARFHRKFLAPVAVCPVCLRV